MSFKSKSNNFDDMNDRKEGVQRVKKVNQYKLKYEFSYAYQYKAE